MTDRVDQDDYWAQQRYDDAVFAQEQEKAKDDIVHNVFDEGVEYKLLEDEIGMRTFWHNVDFKYPQEAELKYLQPQLEHLLYTDIQWGSGERDSFGPLTRTCKAVNHFGKTVWFVYG